MHEAIFNAQVGDANGLVQIKWTAQPSALGTREKTREAPA